MSNSTRSAAWRKSEFRAPSEAERAPISPAARRELGRMVAREELMEPEKQGPRLRVALNASFWGQETAGSGQYLHHLVDELVKLEDGPEVVLCGPADLFAGRPLPAGAHWHTLATSPWRRLGANLEKVWNEQTAFPRAAAMLGAAVAHVPYFASPYTPRTPTVVTVHDLIPLLLPAYRGSALVRAYMRLVAASARRADLILTDAEATVPEIVRRLGVPRERVRAVLLAASPAYRPGTEPEVLAAVRARYELPEAFLLYLGGFDQRRNLATLFRAWGEARRREPHLPVLALAGALPTSDTPFAPDPRRLAREAGISESVRFLGRVPEGDKPALYGAATAFLFPSRHEGFGLPVLESLACGTPAVIAEATSLPEVGGPGALWVGADDIAGWADAICRIATDNALRARLRAAGLAHASTFSWRRTAQETAAAYRDAHAAALRFRVEGQSRS